MPPSSALRISHSVAGSSFGEQPDLAAAQHRHRHAVAIQHAVAGQRGKPRPGVRMPARLSGSAPDSDSHSSVVRPAAHLAQQPTASGSANCSPVKPATKRPPRISPRALEPAIARAAARATAAASGLALEQAPEHHAVAAQQRARDVLDRLRRRAARSAALRRRRDQRPAAGVLDAEQRRRADGAGRRPAARSPRHQQRAQAGEAVGGDEAERDQLGQRLLEPACAAGRVPSTISSKNEAPCARQELDAPLRALGARLRVARRGASERHSAHVAARQQRDRRGAHRRRAGARRRCGRCASAAASRRRGPARHSSSSQAAS